MSAIPIDYDYVSEKPFTIAYNEAVKYIVAGSLYRFYNYDGGFIVPCF